MGTSGGCSMRGKLKRSLGKSRRRLIAVVLSGVALAGVVACGALLLWVRALGWDNERFSAAVADAVAQGVANGVAAGMQKAGDDLAAISPPGKPITLEDLTRWRELVERGEEEQAAGELRARYTDEENRQICEGLERVMKAELAARFTEEEARQFLETLKGEIKRQKDGRP